MLKKMLVMSMACAISCNISFSKPTRALDLAEIVLSETEKSGIRFLMSMDWAEYNKMYNLYYNTGGEVF